jgi:hypothetical protein
VAVSPAPLQPLILGCVLWSRLRLLSTGNGGFATFGPRRAAKKSGEHFRKWSRQTGVPEPETSGPAHSLFWMRWLTNLKIDRPFWKWPKSTLPFSGAYG